MLAIRIHMQTFLLFNLYIYSCRTTYIISHITEIPLQKVFKSVIICTIKNHPSVVEELFFKFFKRRILFLFSFFWQEFGKSL